jgi:RNA polymerase primary sigma factor
VNAVDLIERIFGQKVIDNLGIYNSVEKQVTTLNPNHFRVISLRFGLYGVKPLLLREVADFMGISKSRVCQIQRDALRRLRHPTRSKYLTQYVSRNGSSNTG